MLVCVDGTGVTDTDDYRYEFTNSFVNRIKNRYMEAHPPPEPTPIHHRGPGTDAVGGVFGGSRHVDPQFVVDEVLRQHGVLTDMLDAERDAIPSWVGGRPVSEWAPEETEELRVINARRRLFMTGYSRGGAIVLHAARLLISHGINVDAMFLFDAVDRNPFMEAEQIPSNVRHCYHAMRDPAGGSRESFGNCGTSAATGVIFKRRHFMTTHGGMGGVPWGPGAELDADHHIVENIDGSTNLSVNAELDGLIAVREWMTPWLLRHGVVATAL